MGETGQFIELALSFSFVERILFNHNYRSAEGAQGPHGQSILNPYFEMHSFFEENDVPSHLHFYVDDLEEERVNLHPRFDEISFFDGQTQVPRPIPDPADGGRDGDIFP
jgi:hypothetical protein